MSQMWKVLRLNYNNPLPEILLDSLLGPVWALTAHIRWKELTLRRWKIIHKTISLTKVRDALTLMSLNFYLWSWTNHLRVMNKVAQAPIRSNQERRIKRKGGLFNLTKKAAQAKIQSNQESRMQRKGGRFRLTIKVAQAPIRLNQESRMKREECSFRLTKNRLMRKATMKVSLRVTNGM